MRERESARVSFSCRFLLPSKTLNAVITTVTCATMFLSQAEYSDDGHDCRFMVSHRLRNQHHLSAMTIADS